MAFFIGEKLQSHKKQNPAIAGFLFIIKRCATLIGLWLFL
jgi:hypothetical protein